VQLQGGFLLCEEVANYGPGGVRILDEKDFQADVGGGRREGVCHATRIGRPTRNLRGNWTFVLDGVQRSGGN
jgi:hypothetical protein